MEKNKNYKSTFIMIVLMILGYLGLKVFQKYSFNKEYESAYSGLVIQQKADHGGFDNLYLSNGNRIPLAFYEGWAKDSPFVGDSVSKDKNSTEIRIFRKDKSLHYQYYKSLDMILD
ncbi:hypothetical protein CLU97_0623 [Chryseobacterium sp. 7]|uniref:hypothetical protein n=1 Tax=Chryseobacterium sp. 7 TaxID=2035214 RepID=UPI000EB36756|nr:hypothetical protein [Chryseobacterium sp. 7]RLJ31215.1 hypothetical protein CLU97_0623 [Chryseobacterium sp. 7]